MYYKKRTIQRRHFVPAVPRNLCTSSMSKETWNIVSKETYYIVTASVSKETYYIGHRDLLYCHLKRVKRDLVLYTYSQTYCGTSSAAAPRDLYPKETYYIGKRDLLFGHLKRRGATGLIPKNQINPRMEVSRHELALECLAVLLEEVCVCVCVCVCVTHTHTHIYIGIPAA
jgi:uncharacterized protein (DUF779 family)